MNDGEEERKQAIKELKEALQELSLKDGLSLREKALVLEAIEKIEGEES